MTTATFLILLVVTNVACGFLGFLFGRMTRAAVQLEEAELAEHAHDSPPPQAKQKAERTNAQVTGFRTLALVVALIGASTVVLGIIVTREQAAADARDDRLTACVTGYSNALADALEQRTTASASATEQQDAVWRTIFDAFNQASPDARAAVQRSINEYLEARDKAKTAAKKNPLPKAPRDACAELLDK